MDKYSENGVSTIVIHHHKRSPLTHQTLEMIEQVEKEHQKEHIPITKKTHKGEVEVDEYEGDLTVLADEVGHIPLIVGYIPLIVGHMPLLLGHIPLTVAHIPLIVGYTQLIVGHILLIVGNIPLIVGNKPLIVGHIPLIV